MALKIPYERWRPLSVSEVASLFDGASFQWCLAGGYAIEQFLGYSVRSHSDIDIIVYRDQQLKLQEWLNNWKLYAADPPGTLRKWQTDEQLPVGIHDIWGHQISSDAWQLQIMLTEVEGTEWVSRRNALIRGKRNELIVVYDNIPCIRPEIQLLYKAKNRRPKDEQDFLACLPKLDEEAKHWLKESLTLLYPQGHEWLKALS